MKSAEISDPSPDLPASIVDAEWVGSPNMGTTIFKHDGTVWTEKDDKPCRWAVIGPDTIISLHSNGATAVFDFDKARQKVTAYATGQKSGVAWEATRSPNPSGK
jgi:hypothetical protein